MDKRLCGLPREAATLVELLRWRSKNQPEKHAYTFLLDGELEEFNLSYSELDRQARAISALLQRHAAVGERALLLYPPGLEFITAFFGCLYAGIIAVPAYPPNLARLERTLPRLRTIVQDAKPAVVLTTAAIQSGADRLLAQAPDFQNMYWLATNAVDTDLADQWEAPAINEETLAFLQYTSGSTAAPKGVMVSHRNLLCNEQMLQQAFQHTDQSTIVIWLPLFHDMGLIGNVLQSMYVGATCILMAPTAFLQRPLRWLQAISRYRASTSGGPNFAYDLCVQKITAEQRATLDLSSWSIAFNGSEPVRAHTIQRFTTTFAPAGFRAETFYPCYGLAEATLFVTGGLKAARPIVQPIAEAALTENQVIPAVAGQDRVQTLVGCGQSWLEQKIRIVDPVTLRTCSQRQVGEIWIAGPHVARGYWNNPAVTARVFQAYAADTDEGPFLRTGDLGFIQKDEIFVTGRLKDVIIINGRNHYPQDIEQTVEQSHPALRLGCCAAFAVEADGEERLIVAAEVDRHHRAPDQHGLVEEARISALGAAVDHEVLIKTIRRAVVAQHDLRAYDVVLLKVGGMPKTSSGKVQRHACRNGFLNGSLELWGNGSEKSKRAAVLNQAVAQPVAE